MADRSARDPDESNANQQTRDVDKLAKSLARRLEGIPSAFKATTTAAVAVAAAAFPTVYQLDPELATRAGFWADYKWIILIAWALALLAIGYRLALGQIRESDAATDLAADIESKVDNLTQVLRQEFDSQLHELRLAITTLHTLRVGIDQAAGGIAGVERTVRLTAIRQEISERLRTSAKVQNPLQPLAVIDDRAVVSIFAKLAGDEDHILVYPVDDAQAEDPSHLLQNIFQLACDVALGDVKIVPLGLSQQLRLPIRWRDSIYVIISPLWTVSAEYVGALVVAFPFKFDSGPGVASTEQLVARCRNMSEDVAPLVASAREYLNFAQATVGD